MTDQLIRINLAIQTDVGVPRQLYFDCHDFAVTEDGVLILCDEESTVFQQWSWSEWIAFSVQKVNELVVDIPNEQVVDYGGDFMGRANITAEEDPPPPVIPSPVEEVGDQEWDGSLMSINAAALVVDEQGAIYKDRHGLAKTMPKEDRLEQADLILTQKQIRTSGMTPQ